MRNAITPVISVTLLIFITLVAGVGAYAWFSTIQSDLQESISGNVESFPGSDCSQLNLISMRGDGVVISNVGCDTISTVNIFIDGVLTSYDLNEPLEPGAATTISYTALSANQSHTLQIALKNGKVISDTISKEEATSEAGFTEEETGGCEETSCTNPAIMFYGTIINTLSNATCACCGDDNLNDVFYNSTHYCSYSGVIFNQDNLYIQDWKGDKIDYASGKAVCELAGNTWMEGSASFADGVTKSTGDNPYGIAVSDFNEDGDLDVVLTDRLSVTFSYFAGNGDGTFADRTTKGTGLVPYFMDVGDFDNDNNLDVVLTDSNSATFSYFAGGGDGTFAGRTTKSTGSGPTGIAVGDFKNDGDLDVIVVSSSTDFFYYFDNTGITGANGPCCGDDGATDDFSNSTHQCVNGAFSAI